MERRPTCFFIGLVDSQNRLNQIRMLDLNNIAASAALGRSIEAQSHQPFSVSVLFVLFPALPLSLPAHQFAM
jgi:hypothetical protein